MLYTVRKYHSINGQADEDLSVSLNNILIEFFRDSFPDRFSDQFCLGSSDPCFLCDLKDIFHSGIPSFSCYRNCVFPPRELE